MAKKGSFSKVYDKNGDYVDVEAARFDGTRTFQMQGDVTASQTWNGDSASALTLNTSIGAKKVTTDKINDKAVQAQQIDDGAVGLTQIATTAMNGTVQDNDSKLATHAAVKTYVDAQISGQGTYLGKHTVAEINAMVTDNLHNGDRVMTSDSGTINLGPGGVGFDVEAGEDLILYKSGSTVQWDSMDGNFKTKQTAVSDPTASGTGLTFIDSASQDENGEMTLSKKTVQDGTTSQKGVVQLEDSHSSTSTTKAATPNSVKEAYDLANTANTGAVKNVAYDSTNKKITKTINGTTSDVVSAATLKTDMALNNVDNTSDANKPVSTAQQAALDLKLDKTGDGKDVTATFTEASTRENIGTGEKLSVIFGKIKKWFTDLKALAFKDKVGDGDIDGTITDTHISSASTWNGKYDKPSGGIPKSDLSAGVQASLDLADSAVQDVSGKADKVSNATSGNFAGLDSSGNLTDSGSKASDFAASSHTHSVKINGVDKTIAAPGGTAVDLGNYINRDTDAYRRRDNQSGGGWGKIASISARENGNTITTTWLVTYFGAQLVSTGTLELSARFDSSGTPSIYLTRKSLYATNDFSENAAFALKVTGVAGSNATIELWAYLSKTWHSISIQERSEGYYTPDPSIKWTYTNVSGGGTDKPVADASSNVQVIDVSHVYIARTASTSRSGWMTSADKTKLDGIATGAEVNQNAFGNVKVGSTTVTADSKTDTLEIVGGTGIDATGDATNDKVTLALDSASQTSLGKADTAIQGVKVNGTTLTPDANKVVTVPLATTSADGAMSAADKTKLNGIAEGAEVNVQADWDETSGDAAILHKPFYSKYVPQQSVFKVCSFASASQNSASSFGFNFLTRFGGGGLYGKLMYKNGFKLSVDLIGDSSSSAVKAVFYYETVSDVVTVYVKISSSTAFRASPLCNLPKTAMDFGVFGTEVSLPEGATEITPVWVANSASSSGTAPVKVDAYGALTPVPMDSTPTASSTNLMTSGDIKTAIDAITLSQLNGILLTSSDDIDTLFLPVGNNYAATEKWYYTRSSEGLPQHMPEDATTSAIRLIASNAGADRTIQFVYPAASPFYFVRYKTSTGWSNWDKVYFAPTSSYSPTGAASVRAVNGAAVAAALATSLTDVEYVAAQSGGGGNLNKTKNGSTTSVLAFMTTTEARSVWTNAKAAVANAS